MKKITSLPVLLVAITLVLMCSCKKEAGPVGPKGDPGINGNANVTQISFGSKTIAAGGLLELTLPGISKSIAEKSLILTYAQNGGLWYHVPGFGLNGTREYRTFIEAADPSSVVAIRMVTTGAGSETFSAIRVIIIPANNLINGRKSQLPYDILNYESVRNYFKLHN